MSPKERPSVKREVTSIKVNPELWKEAKIAAIRQDIELSELVEDAIAQWIKYDPKKLGDNKKE